MNVNKAIAAAKKQCEHLGYDASKIDTTYKQFISGVLYIAYFPCECTDGLLSDFDTRAIPIISVDDTYNVFFLENAEHFFRRDE